MSRITDKFMDKPNRVIRQTTKHFIENLSLGKNPSAPKKKKNMKAVNDSTNVALLDIPG